MEPEEQGIKVMNTAALGKSCVETLRYHQEQLALLDARAAKIRDEAAKLVQIAQFAGVDVPAELVAMAKGAKTAKVDGRSIRSGPPRGEFTCDVCGKVSPTQAGFSIHRARAHSRGTMAVVP